LEKQPVATNPKNRDAFLTRGPAMTTSSRFTDSKPPNRLAMTIGSALVAAAAIAAATLIALHGGEVTASEQPAAAPAVPMSVATVIQAPVTEGSGASNVLP
jgi:hypothetical protein